MGMPKKLLKGLINPMTALIVTAIIVLSYYYIDKPLTQWFSDLALGQRFPVLEGITDLGSVKIYLLLFLGAGLVFRYGVVSPIWESRAWFLSLCTIFPDLVCIVLKIVLGRARPVLWLNEKIYGFYGVKASLGVGASNYWSFPSGHTTTIMGVVFGLSALFPRYWILFVASGTCVVLSRVLLLHHYLSDVIAATYLTLLEVSFLIYVLRKRNWLSESIVK